MFLTTEKILTYLQVSLLTVYGLIKAGTIPAVWMVRQRQLKKRDLHAWLDSQATGPVAPTLIVTGFSKKFSAIKVLNMSVASCLLKSSCVPEILSAASRPLGGATTR